MTKNEVIEQKAINEICVAYYKAFMTEYKSGNYTCLGRLRHCSACVYETENFYILRSYGTIIAAIEKKSDTLIDVLRYVYGYTATSAQHISKFSHDYKTIGNFSCFRSFRYYEVPAV